VKRYYTFFAHATPATKGEPPPAGIVAKGKFVFKKCTVVYHCEINVFRKVSNKIHFLKPKKMNEHLQNHTHTPLKQISNRVWRTDEGGALIDKWKTGCE
jgi:hypothetical protein